MTHIEKVENLVPQINELGNEFFPHFKTTISKLGGENRASILISLSLDKKDDWPNGVFENSMYTRFYISKGTKKDFEVEQFSRHYNFKKIRKAQTNDVIDRLNVIFKKLK
jgi:hypothetical protein